MANTVDPTVQARPNCSNRSARRFKPSGLGAFLALQLALGLERPHQKPPGRSPGRLFPRFPLDGLSERGLCKLTGHG